MKTNWSIEYVEAKHGIRESKTWVREQEKQFEKETGVPWSCQAAMGQFQFAPHLEYLDVEADATDKEITAIWRVLDRVGGRLDGVRFILISEKTGIPLPRLMQIVKRMFELMKVKLDINRMGKLVSVRLMYRG